MHQRVGIQKEHPARADEIRNGENRVHHRRVAAVELETLPALVTHDPRHVVADQIRSRMQPDRRVEAGLRCVAQIHAEKMDRDGSRRALQGGHHRDESRIEHLHVRRDRYLNLGHVASSAAGIADAARVRRGARNPCLTRTSAGFPKASNRFRPHLRPTPTRIRR